MEEVIPIPTVEKRQIVVLLNGRKITFDLERWAKMHLIDTRDFGNVTGIRIRVPLVCSVYDANRLYICSSFQVGYRKCNLSVEQCREKKLPLPYKAPWYMFQDDYVVITFGIYPDFNIWQYSPRYVEKDLGHLRGVVPEGDKGKLEVWKVELRSLREAAGNDSVTWFNVLHTKWGKLYRKDGQVFTNLNEVKNLVVNDLVKRRCEKSSALMEYLFA